MIAFIKRNLFIIFIFFITLLLGFVTFLTFIDKGFITQTNENLKYLLIFDIILLLFFFLIIFKETQSYIKKNINVRGSISNRKYIVFFSLFTLIPSILISIFSLFLFSFALEKYFDNKITVAVNNSYEIAKKYVSEKRNKVASDILLVAYDIDKNLKYINKNKKNFQLFLNNQRIVRGLDQIHIIDNNKNIYLTSSVSGYLPIEDKALKMVLNDDRPLKIINAFENKSAAIIKLQNFNDKFLYVVKFLDQDISKYLRESEEAVNFYYTVDDKSLGIKFSFALIYIIIVTLLLFLSITIAIRFSSRFFISINNLISASSEIGKGNLDIKVPEIKSDQEIELLNSNFNAMIERLKNQQEKLLISERHEAWNSVARKLAHEIKNPLTPIQLIIDNLRSKYLENIEEKNKEKFKSNLDIIVNQIKQIENLVNEFSDFARMPKPLLKKNSINQVILNNIKLLNKSDTNTRIVFNNNNKSEIYFNFDQEQINRAIFNLIKNSLESISEKREKNVDFQGLINMEIESINEYINVYIKDNGTGFSNKNSKDLIKPYYTTKKNGSGLGLSIVNKILSDHNGKLFLSNYSKGAKIKLQFNKHVD
tara:strand:+ start:2049 stop:3830 length:1782 start_codon:yes stop_codon:yes gene_type:complete